jgi:L-alanine-DL-glutamate epimerase-like enolase superfamily enzyme
MKITKVETRLHRVTPRAEPIRDALQSLPGAGSVTVHIHSDEGFVGEGTSSFGRIQHAPQILQQIIELELAPQIIGEDPFAIKRIREQLRRETEYHSWSGLIQFGISVIDIALWDLMGKTLGQPVHKILGTYADRVPAYAMVGWLNYEIDELKQSCVEAMEQGLRAVKIKVGCPTLDEDVQRIEAVWEVIGKGAVLMVDANQVFSTAEALIRGRVYQELGCYWFEEPFPTTNKEGLAELAQHLEMRVASGENEYGKWAIRELLEMRAVDVLQGDLRRSGGVTEIMEIAAIADAFNIPYASHGGGVVNLHLLAAMPNACYLETGLVHLDLPPRIENGYALVPQGSGFSRE